MVRVDGGRDYMCTLVLGVESYGVSLYSMCSNILPAYVYIFLQLLRTSSLRLWDNRVLSD